MLTINKQLQQVLAGLAGILFLLGCTQQPSTPITATILPPSNTSTAIPTAASTSTPTLTPPPTITFTPTYPINPDGLFLSDMRPDINPENIHGGLALDRVFWQPQIWINGKYYEKGLGMHPPENGIAFVGYRVPKGYAKFLALAGLAREDGNPYCNTVGSARFRVFVNNDLAFASDIVHFGRPVAIEIPVKEGDTLRLEVEKGGDDYTCDHATWAEARFEP